MALLPQCADMDTHVLHSNCGVARFRTVQFVFTRHQGSGTECLHEAYPDLYICSVVVSAFLSGVCPSVSVGGFLWAWERLATSLFSCLGVIISLYKKCPDTNVIPNAGRSHIFRNQVVF